MPHDRGGGRGTNHVSPRARVFGKNGKNRIFDIFVIGPAPRPLGLDPFSREKKGGLGIAASIWRRKGRGEGPYAPNCARARAVGGRNL